MGEERALDPGELRGPRLRDGIVERVSTARAPRLHLDRGELAALAASGALDDEVDFAASRAPTPREDPVPLRAVVRRGELFAAAAELVARVAVR